MYRRELRQHARGEQRLDGVVAEQESEEDPDRGQPGDPGGARGRDALGGEDTATCPVVRTRARPEELRRQDVTSGSLFHASVATTPAGGRNAAPHGRPPHHGGPQRPAGVPARGAASIPYLGAGPPNSLTQ